MMEINSRETKYLIEVLRAAAKGEKPAAPEGIDWNEFLNCQKATGLFYGGAGCGFKLSSAGYSRGTQ